jgi:acyl-coenzyme A thioesterase PaaI-like protein
MPLETLEYEPVVFTLKSKELCVVCSPEHPTGLRIRYRTTVEGMVTANWTPSSEWTGFPGIIHGGVVSTVLDEAMSKAVAAAQCHALTAELRVRFHKPVSCTECVSIRGWIVSRSRRLFRTEASLKAADGTELAHAWATFLPLRQPKAPI